MLGRWCGGRSRAEGGAHKNQIDDRDYVVERPGPLQHHSHLTIPTRSCARSFFNRYAVRPSTAALLNDRPVLAGGWGTPERTGVLGAPPHALYVVRCTARAGRVVPDAAWAGVPRPGTCATCGTDSTCLLSSRRSSTSASRSTGNGAKSFCASDRCSVAQHGATETCCRPMWPQRTMAVHRGAACHGAVK